MRVGRGRGLSPFDVFFHVFFQIFVNAHGFGLYYARCQQSSLSGVWLIIALRYPQALSPFCSYYTATSETRAAASVYGRTCFTPPHPRFHLGHRQLVVGY